MAKEINLQTKRPYRSKGSCDVRKMKWVAEGGSIFTEEVVESKGDAGVFVKARISITFNVGDKVAKRIVELHNGDIDEQKRRAEDAVPRCAGCGTTKNLHEDYGSGGPYRCDSPNCMIF